MALVADMQAMIEGAIAGGAVLAEDVARLQRMEQCEACPMLVRDMQTCGACGCYLPLKVRFAAARCPQGHW